jgi:5-amino-6-(5-phosphoribosylamino)uracil reductase/diaminohydroxyphosphoribosylaminopyrimidine deaminase/5-amino-6-(5-phosphoribosylamino)uracil reductase
MRITISYAQTLDGRIATQTGDSQWIGGPESLRLAHELRASHDAVLVGVGTVVKDNPRLTTRLVEGRSPVRVVLDSRLRIPLDAHVLSDRTAPTVVVVTQSARRAAMERIRERGAEVLIAGGDAQGRVNLPDAVRLLAARGIGSLLIEGGAGIITSVLNERLCDRLVVCIAPKIVGSGVDAVGDLGISRLRDALAFSGVRLSHCGEDIIFDGELAGVAVA